MPPRGRHGPVLLTKTRWKIALQPFQVQVLVHLLVGVRLIGKRSTTLDRVEFSQDGAEFTFHS